MRSKYFELYELFPEELYNYLKDTISEDVMWKMVEDRLILSIDKIKEKFPKGSMSINTYYWAGNRGWSGLRTKDSPYYSETSQHSSFNAIDCMFSQYATDEVREYILTNPDEFEEIGGVEINVGWLHVDMRPRVNGKIKTFSA